MSISWLETRVPPPLPMAACGGIGWALAAGLPQLDLHIAGMRVAGGLLMLGGAALNIAPKHRFRRAGTTVNPLRPESSSALVQSGLHGMSRNPMYLGHATLLFGLAMLLGNFAAFMATPLYIGWVTRFQIVPEERVLRAKFGTAYIDYCRRVRRWL